jgi:hypothetical protein
VGTVATVHARRGDLDNLNGLSTLDITGMMKLFGRLSKVTQAELGCSSLMFAITHLCRKGDCSVRCGHNSLSFFRLRSMMIALGLLIDSPGELPAGSSPTRFEDDNDN